MYSFEKGYYEEEIQEKIFLVELIANIFLNNQSEYKDGYMEGFLFIGTSSFPEESFNKRLLEFLPSLKLKKKNKEKKSFIFSSYFKEGTLSGYNKGNPGDHKANKKHIFKTLELLDDKGMATFLLNPIYAAHCEYSEDLRSKLKEKGFFINQTIKLPDEVLLCASPLSPILISITRENKEEEFFGEYVNNLLTEIRRDIGYYHQNLKAGMSYQKDREFASAFVNSSYEKKLNMISNENFSSKEKDENIEDLENFYNDDSNPLNPNTWENDFSNKCWVYSSWKNFPGFYRLEAKSNIDNISKNSDYNNFKKFQLGDLVEEIYTISFNSLFANQSEFINAYHIAKFGDDWDNLDDQEKRDITNPELEKGVVSYKENPTREQYQAITGDPNTVSLMALGYPYAEIRMKTPIIDGDGAYDGSPLGENIIANKSGYLCEEFKFPTVYKNYSRDPYLDNLEHSVRLVHWLDPIIQPNTCPIHYGTDPWGSSVMSDIILEGPETHQIKVNREKLLPEYLEYFLNTELGQEYLKYAIAEEKHGPEINGFRREISSNELKKMKIPVPELEEQKKILTSHKRINKVFDRLDETRNNLTYNPINNDKYLSILEDLAATIGELSELDKLKRLINEGESVTLEFKEGFSYDFKESKKQGKTVENKSLKPRILKNIGSFLNNSKGGILLIGVHDNKSITGMNEEINEIHKSDDGFENIFKDYIKDNLGIIAWNNIETKFIAIDNKKIYQVKCYFSEEKIYIKEHGIEKFPARFGPSSELIQGKQMDDYIKGRDKDRNKKL